MTDQAVLPAGRETAEPESADSHDDDLASLRSILIGPAEQKLEALQARIDNRFAQARDVGAVLPQALLQRARDPELARALTPPVERAITASVRRDPKPLADALFPVIGPAIRKAVAASLASMVESLNRTVEHSFSWRALRWRFEAFRTGKPFGEVVLLNTLVYRVEQIFLIHRRTGLLLQHVRAGPARVEDAQLVSAMLTAIRDFVQDSFHTSEHETLDALKVGELSVWVEQGPEAILAAVIRGSAPPERRQNLQRSLETIHLQFADALESFDGDTAMFESSRPYLEECLQTEVRPGTKRRGRGALILLILGLLALGLWGASAYREQRRWRGYVQALRSEPGLVVISSGRSGGKYLVAGLRDPLARDPGAILQESQLSPEDVAGTWEPYHALLPGFVLSRANQVLQPPPGTTLDLQDGVLSATGDAPAAWIADARRIAPLIAGVNRFDAAGVLNARIQSLTGRLESARLLFARGTSRLLPGQEAALQQVSADVRELDALASSSGRVLRIDVLGHTDADGATASNLPLSRARADRVIQALALGSTPHLDIRPVGVGSDEPLVAGQSEAEKQRNRRVAFRASQTPGAGTRGVHR